MDKIRIGLVDDHNVLRQSLAKALNLEFDMEVAGQWKSAEDALEEFRSYRLDVVIMDLKLPGMNGIEATIRLLKMDPRAKVIVLSAYTDEEDVLRSLQAGVLGYLPKEVTVEELVEAVRSVYRGYAALDPRVARKVLEQYSSISRHLKAQEGLSSLETEILSIASSGGSNKEIAENLKLNDGAVKFHFREIFRKLQARDRAHAVALALKQGLIE